MKRNTFPSSLTVTSAMVMCLMLYTLIFSAECARSALSGLEIFITGVFPSLFPFFVLSSFASDINARILPGFSAKIMKLVGAESGGYTYPISLISGYPSSARLISEGYSSKRISARDANILSVLCSNASAAFIISYIGSSLYNDCLISLILLIANYISPIMSAVVLSGKIPPDKGAVNYIPPKTSAARPAIISSFVCSVNTALKAVSGVGGFIVFFTVLRDIAKKISGDNLILNILFSALELSSGCENIAGADISLQAKVALTGFMVCFGGVCVIFQSMAFMNDKAFDKTIFVKYKLLSGISGGIISYFLFSIRDFFRPDEVFSHAGNIHISCTTVNILLLLLFVTIIIYTLIYSSDGESNECKRNTD